MGISEDLKKLIRDGDYQLIVELYKERHELKGDFKTVTREYVRQVITGLKPVSVGHASEEIMEIAIYLLEHKRNFREHILAG